jgi:uncharacterized protein (TIGR00106 family)
MAIIEITIIPVGTGSTSASEFVAEAYKIVKNSGLSFELTPTATVIEGDIVKLFELARKVHESPFKKDVKRVITTIKIDDRRDKPTSIKYKKKSVMEKLGD